MVYPAISNLRRKEYSKGNGNKKQTSNSFDIWAVKALILILRSGAEATIDGTSGFGLGLILHGA